MRVMLPAGTSGSFPSAPWFGGRRLLEVVIATVVATAFLSHASVAADPPATQPAPEANAAAEAKLPILREHYLVVPWRKTELQDVLIGTSSVSKEESRAYVLIDGNSLYAGDNEFAPERFDWDQLREDLYQIVPRRDRKSGTVAFHVWNFSLSAERTEYAGWMLNGFGRQIGFKNASVTQTFTGRGSLMKLVEETATQMAVRPEGPEVGIGNELVQVYPVRTFLSSFRTGRSDCVVQVIPTLGKESRNAVREDVWESILEYVPQVDVPHKGKLYIKVSYTSVAGETVERLRGDGAQQLADALGYESASVTSSPR